MLGTTLLVSILTLIQIGPGLSFAPYSPRNTERLSLKATWSNGQAIKGKKKQNKHL